MSEKLPQSFYDRLEREWRMLDPERPKPEPRLEPTEPLKRLRISRVD